MEKRLPVAIGTLLSGVFLLYGVLVLNELLFGAVSVALVGAVTILWTRDERWHAAVVAILGSVLAAGVYTGRLDYIVAAVLVSGIWYLGWTVGRPFGPSV